MQIITPPAGAVIEEGEWLILRGAGSDLEGELAEHAFAWASDRVGALGVGPRSETMILSAGVHTIALTAQDGEGLTVAAAIAVEVTARPNTQPVADAGPDVTTAGRRSVHLDGGGSSNLTATDWPTCGRSWPPRSAAADRARGGRFSVQWAADGEAAALQDVGVDHGCFDVFMAQELLNGADVVEGAKRRFALTGGG